MLFEGNINSIKAKTIINMHNCVCIFNLSLSRIHTMELIKPVKNMAARQLPIFILYFPFLWKWP